MGDDDDWFERALREDDAEDSDDDSDDSPDSPTETAGQRDESDERPDVTSGGVRPNDEETDGSENSDPFGGVRGDAADSTARGSTDESASGPPDGATESPSDAGAPGSADAAGDGDGIWSDFGSALENAPGPDSDGGSPDSDPFGGESGDAGFGSDDGAVPTADDFDQGGPAPSGPETFDEEDFESKIDRIDIGIDGLDEMILGGVPARSLMVAIGSAGTGKTTFGLQFLNCALERGESAVFITLEETRERIVETAEEKGWAFEQYESEGRLAVVDLDPVEMANSLESIQNDLPRLVEAFGADRLVLDSVSLLEMMYDHPSKRRTSVFNFGRSLKEAGVTTMLTSEASNDNPYVSRHGLIEYLADAVFVLQYVRPNDLRETRLAIEIQKIRDANHSRETKPYELTSEGISVYGRANIF